MALEVEKKFLDADLEAVRMRLADMGAISQGLHFEHNEILDTKGSSLLAQGSLLRLRSRKWADYKDFVLTFKCQPPANMAQWDCKIRQEMELKVENAATMAEILAHLGYAPVAAYEKFRESWNMTLPDGSGVKIDMDELPFRNVIEIEGTPEAIAGAALVLGMEDLAASAESYHQIHQQWLAAHDLPPENSFVFKGAALGEKMRRLGQRQIRQNDLSMACIPGD